MPNHEPDRQERVELSGVNRRVKDAPPAAPPLPTATIIEMIDVSHDEAMRIESTQEALVRGGSRKAPDPQQIRKMEILQALVRLLEAIDRRPRAVKAAIDGPIER